MKWLGKILLAFVFPWGSSYKKPSDAVCHDVVQPMLVSSAFRDRLTRFCFISDNPDDPIRRQEIALDQMWALEPTLKKFHTALRDAKVAKYAEFDKQVAIVVEAGGLTKEEGHSLTEYNALLQQVIKVNEFTFDLSKIVS